MGNNTSRRRKASISKRRRKRRRQLRIRILLFVGMITCGFGWFMLRDRADGHEKAPMGTVETEEDERIGAPDIDVELLDVNEYSRPGLKRESTNGIVIHYVANPGSTAMDNRNYFQGLKDAHLTHASSHFVVGLEGEIVQCVPLNEISYASNDRNVDTIAIECCHPDDSGKFNEKTYESVVKLSGWLCEKYDLPEDAIIRHYDVTGKLCPKYYVEHEDEWLQLRKDIFNRKEEIEEMKKEDGFFKK